MDNFNYDDPYGFRANQPIKYSPQPKQEDSSGGGGGGMPNSTPDFNNMFSSGAGGESAGAGSGGMFGAGGATGAGASGAAGGAASNAGGIAGSQAGTLGSTVGGGGAEAVGGAAGGVGGATPWGAIAAAGLTYKSALDNTSKKKKVNGADMIKLAYPTQTGMFGKDAGMGTMMSRGGGFGMGGR